MRGPLLQQPRLDDRNVRGELQIEQSGTLMRFKTIAKYNFVRTELAGE